ncbi:hypothetical protein QH494_14245 [Sphingomonas sp. AR_OL41]|uniref:hypothetical protein n=1 Tax=Sphingomonas sp. AR_OL41 TaxID=3042729 RepID=UPI002480294E|nr:hypothetical protein [Sphingomonas sp. AR_OL41]MDH7973346.1 hypothetical protein [Sphingomonas sp. AR_OL41]
MAGARIGRRSAAGWLGIAASPVFAIMALLTARYGNGPADLLCSALTGWPLGGMAPMYALMSLFHSAPWIELLTTPRRR